MSNYSIDYDTELMQNYLQTEIMAPDKGFQALQTDVGNAMLFSLGTDHELYVTEQKIQSSHGWERKNLSQSQVSKDFAGQTGIICSNFAVAQSVEDSKIHMAMVLSDSESDHLYLSLNNSASDTSWSDSPTWASYPYDDPNKQQTQVNILRVFLTETTDHEYIVVDIVRDPKSQANEVKRYWVDPSKADGHAWKEHDLPADIDVDNYSSCLGRRAGHHVDGIYTSGHVGNKGQLIYQPLFNRWNPKAAPLSDTLEIPGKVPADAIASCRHPDNTSDLYATAGRKLYYFAAAKQGNGDQAVELLANDLFTDVLDLYAMDSGDKVTVWGRNRNHQIFYTTCPKDELTNSSSWSVPVPIMKDVEAVSPYVNRGSGANTFFAHTSVGQLTIAVKSPETTLWTHRNVTLPPPDSKQNAQSFSSYTTRIQVTKATGEPASQVMVNLSSRSNSSVYINHMYYVIGPKPIQVETDAMGELTVVEAVKSVTGARLTASIVHEATTKVEINPMHKPIQKAVSLQTPAKLQDATITHQDGTTKKLVKSGVSTHQLQAVATANQQLAKVYDHVSKPKGATAPQAAVSSTTVTDALLVDAGDLLSWVGHEIGQAAEIVWDVAKRVYKFEIMIADQMYHAILHGIEEIGGALHAMYADVVADAEDVVSYLKFLFDLDSMRRTKNVMSHVLTLYIKHQVSEIETYRQAFDAALSQADTAIKRWDGKSADILNQREKLPKQQKNKELSNHSAPGGLIAHHFSNHIGASSMSEFPTPQVPPKDIAPLSAAYGNPSSDVVGLATKLEGVFTNISEDINKLMKDLLAVIAEAGIEALKSIGNALLHIGEYLLTSMLTWVTEPIYIPVVSDILHEFGVDDFSLLDVLSWLAAIPYTIAYKVITGYEPYDTKSAEDILQTEKFKDLLNLNVQAARAAATPVVYDAQAMPESGSRLRKASESSTKIFDDVTAKDVYMASNFFAGIFFCIGCVVREYSLLREKERIAIDIPADPPLERAAAETLQKKKEKGRDILAARVDWIMAFAKFSTELGAEFYNVSRVQKPGLKWGQKALTLLSTLQGKARDACQSETGESPWNEKQDAVIGITIDVIRSVVATGILLDEFGQLDTREKWFEGFREGVLIANGISEASFKSATKLGCPGVRTTMWICGVCDGISAIGSWVGAGLAASESTA